jgi:hypothetical protein
MQHELGKIVECVSLCGLLLRVNVFLIEWSFPCSVIHTRGSGMRLVSACKLPMLLLVCSKLSNLNRGQLCTDLEVCLLDGTKPDL